MADAFPYLDSTERGYLSYVDADTDEMLVAHPGRSYRMRAVEENLPVPPGDGRWGDKPAPPARPAAPAATTARDAGETEGER